MISSLAATSAPAPSVTLFRNTIGVLPGGPTRAFASRGGDAALRLRAAATCPLLGRQTRAASSVFHGTRIYQPCSSPQQQARTYELRDVLSDVQLWRRFHLCNRLAARGRAMPPRRRTLQRRRSSVLEEVYEDAIIYMLQYLECLATHKLYIRICSPCRAVPLIIGARATAHESPA